MTDADRMLAWLRETLDAAEKRADRWHDVECLVHDISLADAVVLQGATLCVCDGPAAVLRRIVADRQLLAEHEPETFDPKHCAVCVTNRLLDPELWKPDVFPCQTVRLLAEGWGWTEETT